MKKKNSLNELWHYIVGTLLIIFGGHWLSGIIGLEGWAINNGIIGYSSLFLYYLVIYIVVDQSLHKLFNLN